MSSFRRFFKGYNIITVCWFCLFRGVSQRVSTAQLSRKLGIDYSNLLSLRHQMQENAYLHVDRTPLEDTETETDEMFQNAGKRGEVHLHPDDPLRKRANKKRTWHLSK